MIENGAGGVPACREAQSATRDYDRQPVLEDADPLGVGRRFLGDRLPGEERPLRGLG